MSYMEVKYLTPKERIKTVLEIRNSWGFAPVIWGELSKRYIYANAWLVGKDDKLWKLFRETIVPDHWRIALAVTFDWAIIEKAKLIETAKCLKICSGELTDYQGVNHLTLVAETLEKYADRDILGMCMYINSVSEDVWTRKKKDRKGFFVWEETFAAANKNVQTTT